MVLISVIAVFSRIQICGLGLPNLREWRRVRGYAIALNFSMSDTRKAIAFFWGDLHQLNGAIVTVPPSIA